MAPFTIGRLESPSRARSSQRETYVIILQRCYRSATTLQRCAQVKEAALAHTIKSKTERAYRRTDLFEKRREMMREWSLFVGGDSESKGTSE